MSEELEEYLRAKEPEKAELAGLWRTAIGLQKVDGLTPSAYLVETARRNIEGEITIAEAGKIIGEYYKSKSVRAEAEKTRTDEADYELKSRYLLVGQSDEGSSLVPSEREQVEEQVREQVSESIPTSVMRLLKIIKGEMSVVEMMMALKLGGRRNFLEKYLTPAIDLGFVEMTQPNSPRSPTQKYRFTVKGKHILV